MSGQQFDININALEFLAPVVAAQMVNSFYSALLLKKMSGAEISREVEQTVWGEVLRRWSNLLPGLVEEAKKSASRRPADSQSEAR